MYLAHFELEIVLIIIYCYMCPVQQGTAEIPLQTCPGQCSCQAVVCHQPFVPLAHGVAVIKGIHQFSEQICSEAQQQVEMGLRGCAESSWNLITERLDSAYGWLPWPDTLPTTPLGLLSDPCQTPLGANLPGANLEGQLALALLPDDWHALTSCSLTEIVRRAQVCWLKYVLICRGTYHLLKMLLDYLLSQGLAPSPPLSAPPSCLPNDVAECRAWAIGQVHAALRITNIVQLQLAQVCH